jgi:hypothetical protein
MIRRALAVLRIAVATALPCKYSAPRVRLNLAGLSNPEAAIANPHSLWCTECPRCGMHQAPRRAIADGCCARVPIAGCPFEPSRRTRIYCSHGVPTGDFCERCNATVPPLVTQ